MLYNIFKLLRIKIIFLMTFQIIFVKQIIMNEFNKKKFDLIIFLLLYTLTTLSLNFQHDYWHIYALELTYNLSILAQTIKRARRFENFNKWIYLFEYIIENTFDDKIIIKNLKKIISQIVIELNRQIFYEIENAKHNIVNVDE